MLGAPIVIDNRPGGSQLLAIRTLQSAAADGYTLFVGVGSSLATGPAVRNDLPYDPLKDFTPVVLFGIQPSVLVSAPSKEWKTVSDLIKSARAKPGVLNYASAGVGSQSHLAGVMFLNLAKSDRKSVV